MKKFYSLMFSLAIVCSSIFAQSIQLQTTAGQLIPNGGTIGVIRTLYDTTAIVVEIDMKNISSSSQTYKVIRTVKVLPPLQQTYFCFAGGCFPATTDESPNSLSLNPNTLDNNFSSHLEPNNGKGSALVYYKFFNVKDPNDTIGVYIQTEVWNLGINDISTTRSEIGPVYPNPANEKVTVEYNIVNDVTARLVLRNMLGSTIRDEAVSGIGGKVQINTTDLPEGIYFCSLFIDGKSISTRKLVIRH